MEQKFEKFHLPSIKKIQVYIYTSFLKAVMIKIIMFVMENILLHMLTSMTLDLRWRGQPEKNLKGNYFHQGFPQRYNKKKAGKLR